ILRRLSDPGVFRMPPFGSTVLDEDAIALMSEWVQSFPTMPWRSVNLAIPDQPGGCTASAGVFTVAGGASLNQPDDAGRFLYQSLSNNLQMVAHVLSLPQRDPSPRTGLMIRQSLEVGAPAVALFVDGEGKLGFSHRCC